MLETLDAVLDVGGVYDPSKDRYDHHQKGFEEVFGHGFTTKLSSAGLIYKVNQISWNLVTVWHLWCLFGFHGNLICVF